MCAFLEENDEEQLTISDLVAKMGEYLRGSKSTAYGNQYLKEKLMVGTLSIQHYNVMVHVVSSKIMTGTNQEYPCHRLTLLEQGNMPRSLQIFVPLGKMKQIPWLKDYRSRIVTCASGAIALRDPAVRV